ncbi:MAG: extracellular solute-binding protein [Oscillospiraceae bacterium]|nr:extracellular solute-binding protein [Oscillospiraceae bacterium]
MSKKFVKLIALLMVVTMAFCSLPLSALADNSATTGEAVGEGALITKSDSELISYKAYLAQNPDGKAAEEKDAVYVDGADGTFVPYSGEDENKSSSTAEAKKDYALKADGKDVVRNVIDWQKGYGSVVYTVTVPTSAYYNFYLEFLPPEVGVNIELGLRIDDADYAFEGADSIEFSRDWVNVPTANGEKWREDNRGNQIAPEQQLTGELVERVATDETGVVVEPYMFYLTAGNHTITLDGQGHTVLISKLGFTAPEKTVSYEQYLKQHEMGDYSSVKEIVIQGEDATVKNDSSLIPKSTNGNNDLIPIDPYLTLINNIGGVSWQTVGQKIEWEFTVETAGYYQFSAHYKQSDVVNGDSWRWLKIDGKTPFEEAKTLNFSYDTQWQHYTFGAKEGKTTNPYYIWLEAGTHTVSLEVTLAELADAYDRLFEIVEAIGDMYLQIVMITSETPDTNRSYELFRQIPTFNDTLKNCSDALRALVKDIQSSTGARGSQYIAAMNNMDRVLNQMLEAPYIAHIYVKDYYTNYTTLSSWLSEMKKLPVTIDEMRFTPAGQEADYKTTNFFQDFGFEVVRLWSSFVNDYTLYDETKGGDALKLWVNWGRDQTMALNALIQDDFVPTYDINVNLQIVSCSLINGLLANNFPDVQLYLSRTAPVNYGMRGALLDLTQFDGSNGYKSYEEVLGRYHDGAADPYWYNGSLYAIPDSQGFMCMFYRTDVFEDLGLTVPQTWEEFLYCATIIQRYNMDVYVPYTQITTATTVDAGIGALHLYPTLLMQNGLELYNKERNATNINNVRSIQIFEEWTEMYTDYGYQKQADFYNRLRNGSMPLGISGYSTYFTLYSAAPEIDGRWAIANVPGTHVAEDCTVPNCHNEDHINRLTAGSGSGAGIVAKSPRPDKAWAFLEWWTSADIQTRYSNNVESILGLLGRSATANVEAFNRLGWDPEHLEALNKQWEHVYEVPEVPGSYYTTRAVDQAYWSVINDGINAKDAINKWSLIADNEIKRKIEEYS